MIEDSISDRSIEIPGRLLWERRDICRVDIEPDHVRIFYDGRSELVKTNYVRVFGYEYNIRNTKEISQKMIIPLHTQWGLFVDPENEYLHLKMIEYMYEGKMYLVLDITDPNESKVEFMSNTTIRNKKESFSIR
jgi:hypothetical protein